ncbi:MAG: PqiC family protein [Paracoccaceae bacterium]|jgi:uncharacterized lipoprotein YmbA|nr:PqiC family protein [Paracoccaceae bacterium]MDP5364965.1 PqiC family protein [Paracoccaceae bacterium]
MTRTIPLAISLTLALAACGDTAARYLVEPAPVAEPVALRLASLELRDVVLPAYAEGSQILQQDADGALRPVEGSEWADSSARAVTAALARSLDLQTTAPVAAEPWPLSEPAAGRLDVRIDAMLARADGTFQIAGQYAVASFDGRAREVLERFDIRVPLTAQGPAAIAAAQGQAIDQLAGQIVARLRR